MLRLIVVDDEKIIRETICNLINWNSIGVEVVGVCKNGIEAYDMILDEYPDIVLTDIKMPGLSGLELIQRISQTDHNIEFIILSGYGEFNLAKEAMKWGVRHYLLKPCNELQIIEAMQSVIEDCYKKRAFIDFQKEETILTHNLQKNIIRNMLVEGLSNHSDLSLLIEQYGKFFDFHNMNYELCYLYFLEESNLSECLSRLYDYNNMHVPGLPVYVIYAKNTLLVFFEGYNTNYNDLDEFINHLTFQNQLVSIQYERHSFQNLTLLLHSIVNKLKRYEMIYIMNGLQGIPYCNYTVLFQNVEQLSTQMAVAVGSDRGKLLEDLKELFSSVNDADFLKALITNLLLKRPADSESSSSPMHITEFLLEISESNHVETIQNIFFDKFDLFFPSQNIDHPKCKDFIDKIRSYVDENLSNPNLSLKWIGENYLFMNVDYVSKQFIKQTGDKFSTYLRNARIKKAKKMIVERGIEKIYAIAEEVGCGNNPQYFSQIFKKHTGMTPTEYAKKMNGGF